MAELGLDVLRPLLSPICWVTQHTTFMTGFQIRRSGGFYCIRCTKWVPARSFWEGHHG